MRKKHWIIISLGGSLIVPDSCNINTKMLREFANIVRKLIKEGFSFAIVAGGGATARIYQKAAGSIGELSSEDVDWLGIHATRLNAHLLRAIFRKEASPRIITNPEDDHLPEDFSVLIGAGWKPGWSTDYDATLLATRLNSVRIINLSAASHVYSKDPAKHPEAERFERISWKKFRLIIGEEWVPGMHTPFDPLAAKLCEEKNLEVAILSPEDWMNVEKAIRNEPFRGTIIKN